MPYRISNIFDNRIIATIAIIVLLTQNLFLEGPAISPLKVTVMSLMPLVFISKAAYMSRATLYGTLYMIVIIISGTNHIQSFRFSTIGYLGLFVITFITVYNLVHNGCFSLKYFISLVRYLLMAYIICLICQQVFVLAGIHFMPLINLDNQPYLAIDKLPSLSLEPSHSARIMGVLMYAYMKCNGIWQQETFQFRQLFNQDNKWLTIGFLWSMLTMGSATAFVVLGLLSLYFINWHNALLICPVIIGLIYIGNTLGMKQFDRTMSVTQAAFTLDNSKVVDTDNSASARIVPILNTINDLDLSKKEHWFGYGIDSGLLGKKKQMLGEITDYGFLAYLFGLLLVFTCAIDFWSIPTIMYFVGVGGSTANVAYSWGILLIFMCVRYYSDNYLQSISYCNDDYITN